MSQIRPVSDLRNNFADISHTVHETREPVILTKNGYGDMVVMSYDEYQKIQYEMGVMRELQAAELEAETTTERYAHEDVMDDLERADWKGEVPPCIRSSIFLRRVGSLKKRSSILRKNCVHPMQPQPFWTG